MGSINELDLHDDKDIAEDVPQDLPEIGTFVPALYPGIYAMRLPAELSRLWETFDIAEGEKTIQHIRLNFDREHPLVVFGGEHDGMPLSMVGASSIARPRGKDKVMVSDLAYLLRDALQDKKTKLPTTRSEMLKGLVVAINKGAGKIVYVKVGWSGGCADDKPARFIAEDGSTVQDPNTLGCGARFYLDYRGSKPGYYPIPKGEDGKYQENFTCGQCGASIRVFARVDQWLKPKA